MQSMKQTRHRQQQQQHQAPDAADTGAGGLREVMVILNCSRTAAAAMARRYPKLLDMSSAELQLRLVQMKVGLDSSAHEVQMKGWT